MTDKATPSDRDKLIPLDTQSAIESQDLHTNPAKRSLLYALTAMALIIIVIAVGVIIYILDQQSSDSSEASLDIDWFYNVILSETIDASQLPHGILNKLLNLTNPSQRMGMYRGGWDVNWSYSGRLDPPEEFALIGQNSLTVQARYVYNFAQTYQMTQDPKWLDAMQPGLDLLLTIYYDNVNGGYYNAPRLYRNGTYENTNTDKLCYPQTFMLKCLSKCYEVTLNETYLDKATEIYQVLANNLTDQTGIGLYRQMNENFTINQHVNSRGDNEMLHYFHGLGKLYTAYEMAGDDYVQMRLEVAQRINTVYDFMMDAREYATFNASRFNVDEDGTEYLVIARWFDGNWTAEDNEERLLEDNVNIGHNFEWSLFINEYIDWGIIEMNRNNTWNADNIMNYCMDLGWNETAGIIMGLPDSNEQTRWWIGLEALRTMAYYYYVNEKSEDFDYDRDELMERLISATEGYKKVFYDKLYGGIYYDPMSQIFGKIRSTKAGYHTSECCYEILRFVNFDF